jgi:prolipoprotein diacylglyceryltransferase
MFPFFTISGRTIGMYQIMILAGIFAAGIYVTRICKKNVYDENDAIIFY